MRAPRLLELASFAVSLALLSAFAAPANAAAMCADYNDDGTVTAQDALGVLMTAIGVQQCDMYRCDVDGSGSISATDARRTLGLAVGENVETNCPEDPEACLNDIEFFFQRIWTPILTDCINCHNPQGLASYTDHVLLPPTEDGYLEHNFQVLRNLDTLGKGDLLLTKPQGIDHGGGQRLGITEDSPHYADLSELLDRFDDPVTDCGGRADFWAGVSPMSHNQILHKAAILFAGRRPTTNEEQAVDNGGESELRRQVRRMMSGDTFESFVKEAANDQFLTDKFLGRGKAFNVLQGDYQYPDIYARVDLIRALFGEDAADDAWERTNAALDRPAISTDIIVGFPGESDEDFEASMEAARRSRFVKIHAFPFSPRDRTAAARWRKEFVHQGLVKERMGVSLARAAM